MVRRTWPRFVLEACFLFAVALVSGWLDLSIAAIVAVMFVAYVATAALEWVMSRSRSANARESAGPPETRAPFEPESAVVGLLALDPAVVDGPTAAAIPAVAIWPEPPGPLAPAGVEDEEIVVEGQGAPQDEPLARERREKVVLRGDDIRETIRGDTARVVETNRAASGRSGLFEHAGEVLCQIDMPGNAENEHGLPSRGETSDIRNVAPRGEVATRRGSRACTPLATEVPSRDPAG